MQSNSEKSLNIHNLFYQRELRSGINSNHYKLQSCKLELFKLLEKVNLIEKALKNKEINDIDKIKTHEERGDLYKQIILCCINGMRISQPLIGDEKSIQISYNNIINSYDTTDGVNDFIVFSRYFYIYSVKILEEKYFKIFLELTEQDSKVLIPLVCEYEISGVYSFQSEARRDIVYHYLDNKDTYKNEKVSARSFLIQSYFLNELDPRDEGLKILINQNIDNDIAALSLYRLLRWKIGWGLESNNPIVSQFLKIYQRLDNLSQQGSCVSTMCLIHYAKYLKNHPKFHTLTISQDQIILFHKRAILQGYIRGFEKIREHTLSPYIPVPKVSTGSDNWSSYKRAKCIAKKECQDKEYLIITNKIIPEHYNFETHKIPENIQGDFPSLYSNPDPENVCNL